MARKNSPLRAIRAYCLECEDGSDGVRNCIVESCPLYGFRFGKKPSTIEAIEEDDIQDDMDII